MLVFIPVVAVSFIELHLSDASANIYHAWSITSTVHADWHTEQAGAYRNPATYSQMIPSIHIYMKFT